MVGSRGIQKYNRIALGLLPLIYLWTNGITMREREKFNVVTYLTAFEYIIGRASSKGKCDDPWYVM